MNDIFRAIIELLARQREPGDAYTLVEGRIWRNRAPEEESHHWPYITIAHVGGPIRRMFGPQSLEDGRFQFAVWDDYRNHDPTQVDTIYEALVRNLEWQDLDSLDMGTPIVLRREGLPREVSDNAVISKSGDWLVERLMPR